MGMPTATDHEEHPVLEHGKHRATQGREDHNSQGRLLPEPAAMGRIHRGGGHAMHRVAKIA